CIDPVVQQLAVRGEMQVCNLQHSGVTTGHDTWLLTPKCISSVANCAPVTPWAAKYCLADPYLTSTSSNARCSAAPGDAMCNCIAVLNPVGSPASCVSS